MSLITRCALAFAICGFMIPVHAPKLFYIGNKGDKIISALGLILWVCAVTLSITGLS